MSFDQYFPQIKYLKQRGQIYLDNAATTLKPQCVTDLLNNFYKKQVSNVHRGSHFLSDALTTQYEQARKNIGKWIGSQTDVIFTKSTTEGINFLSTSLSECLNPGDEILLTEMEHHSNIVPWQQLAKKKNLKLKFVSVDETGELVWGDLNRLATSKTKIFAFTYYSNVLGTRNPVEKLCTWARGKNIITVVDAAQALTAEPVDVEVLQPDFLVFSAHKIFAPAGLGVLYAREERLKDLKPYQFGGGMVDDVSIHGSEWTKKPQCFEAGTPFVEGALTLSAVRDFLKEQNFYAPPLRQVTSSLIQKAEEELKKIPGLRIIGTSPTRKSILSFVVEGLHCQDLGQLISQAGVAVRAGHHCCLPLMKRYGLSSGTVRVSFAAYNKEEDVVLLRNAVKKAKEILV